MVVDCSVAAGMKKLIWSGVEKPLETRHICFLQGLNADFNLEKKIEQREDFGVQQQYQWWNPNLFK